MIDKELTRPFLAEFYTQHTMMSYDEAIDQINIMFKTERLHILSTTETNDYDEQFNINLYYIMPDHSFIYRVSPMTNPNSYKEHEIKLNDLSGYDLQSDTVAFQDYLKNEVSESKLKEIHGFDLDIFDDYLFEVNNESPFKDWRSCLKTLNTNDPTMVKKAILAYLTYTESEEWLTETLDYATTTNKSLLSNEIESHITLKAYEQDEV